jgi:Ser-tRNA(Ala) deacylase AlaX
VAGTADACTAAAAWLPAALSPVAVGVPVVAVVNGASRRLSSRLHSAGHLLDKAMTNLGIFLKADKGYHFPDAPYVSYVGAVAPADVAPLVARLQSECDRLVAGNAETRVVVGLPDSAAVRECGVAPEATSHLPPGRPVRIVCVAGDENFCPCGGTHVKRAGDIGAIVVEKVRVKGKETKVYYRLADP